MNAIKVLVTGVGGGGVGEGIVKALNLSKGYEVYGTDIHSLSSTLFRVKKGFCVPPAMDSRYLQRILEICKKEAIKIVIPGSDIETAVIANNQKIFECERIKVIVNPPEVVNICRDGWKTHKFLGEKGFSTPKTWLPKLALKLSGKLKYPLIVKPREGHGSLNLFSAKNKEELRVFLKMLGKRSIDAIVQKEVGSENEEYTIGIVVSQKGRIMSSIAMKRTLWGGASGKVIFDKFDEIKKYAEKIALALGAKGPINVQGRLTNKGFTVFEINPRFSGTAPIRAALGINEPDIAIRDFLGMKIKKQRPVNQKFAIVRGFQEVYVPLEEIRKLEKEGSTSYRGRVYGYF